MYNIYAYNGGTKLTLHEANSNSKIKAEGTYKASINATDSLTLTIMPSNPCYNALYPRQTIIEMYDAANGKRLFRGVVLKPTSAMDNSGNASKTYVCAGELDYLCDTVQPYQQADGAVQFFTKLLNTHNAQIPDSKKIYLGQMNITSEARSRTWHYVSSYQAIVDYVNEYGGEFRLRYGTDGKRYLDYTSTVWDVGSDTKIELAINMRSVSFTIDPTNIASGIYPVGAKLYDDGSSAERLELGEVIWNSALRAKYGDIVTVQTWDDVTLESNLRRKATEWLANQSGELHQYTVDAVELSRIDKHFDEFEVGTQYAIKNKLIGLDDVVRCISKSIDINDPTKASMTFGDRYETLAAIISTQMAGLNTKIDNTASEITASQEAFAQQIVQTQTDLLRGAEGGYKYDRLDDNGKPIETFYLNSPSIETATQALRINRNGIGFWKGTAGGALNGPYTSAWTIDGTFNTAFICGKTITGFTFNNGDGTFVVRADGSVTAKSLAITNGTINCGNGNFVVTSAGAVTAKDISIINGGINCGNGNFVVTSAGAVTAKAISIKGGSFDVEANSTGDDRFVLTYGNYKIYINPQGVWAEDDSYIASLQAGGISVYNKSGTRKSTLINNLEIQTQDGYFAGDVRVEDENGHSFYVAEALYDLFIRTGGLPS